MAIGSGPGDEFAQTRGIERRYTIQLRRVARVVGRLIDAEGDPLADPAVVVSIQRVMANYAETIGPWARDVAARIIAAVNIQDEKSWLTRSRRMSRALREEIAHAPTGLVMRERLAEQVTLIKSLPLEAAQRVHDLTTEGITQGRRAREISKDIQASGEVCKSRADLIARTEIGRTATTLTQARAEHVGSKNFIWRTAEDSRVRPTHAALNGGVFEWNNPPECDPGYHALPGAIFNCRCYPEPIIPDPFG